MKGLIDDLKKDLKLEINKVNDKIDALFKRADESDRRIQLLEDKCQVLEAEVKQAACGSDVEAIADV